MEWENLTSPEFGKAVKRSRGVCVLPLGVMEKHGEHLPLGTDLFQARHIAVEAARREAAVVFPWYYFTQIHEAKHYPGAVALPGELMYRLLLETCEEIARNGLRKIILYNGHGGNNYFLPYFCQMALERPRNYMLFYPQGGGDPELEGRIRKVSKDPYDGHAGEQETSNMLVIAPELVRLKADIPSRGVPKKGIGNLPNTYNGIWWYASQPYHYRGKASLGRADKGRLYLENDIRYLAHVIRAVKKDSAVARYTREFFAKTRH